MDKRIIDWQEFDDLVDKIVENYRQHDIKLIVGISRGGLPLAVKLSNILKVPMECLSWQTRDGDVQDVSHLTKLDIRYQTEDVLFVDDICDSGHTIQSIAGLFYHPNFTTLVDKIPQSNLVQYSPLIIETQAWIQFPWEQ